MWWDCGEFPDSGVAGPNVVHVSVMGKVPDLHPGDSIEVLEVGDTGGIFFHLFEVKLHPNWV